MKKRIIALFIAIIMVFTLLPASAFAANTITNQNIEDAIAYARSQVGRKESDGTPYWDGYCAAFVYAAYHTGAKIKNSSYATARQMGDALLTNTDSNPPRGAFVFWYKASNPQGSAGHVGLSLGGGKVIHSWGSSGILESSISYITNKGYTYRGWGYPIKGYKLATDNSQPTNTTPTITISGAQYPTSITQGSNYGLRGTISTNCGKLTFVKGSIINSSGSTVQTTSENPNASSYDIKNGAINNNLKFGSLKAGTYRYVVYAEAQNGTAKAVKTLLDESFTVNGTTGTISASISGIAGTYSGSTIINTINVSYTKPSGVSSIYFNAALENCSGNISLSWGDWSNNTCPLNVRVTGPETCDIVLSLCDSSNDSVLATTKVSVNVVSYCTSHGHSWNSGVVTVEPTDTKEGVKTYTCTRCGQTKTESIPSTGHMHVYDIKYVVDPTVDQMGYTAYCCYICGDWYYSKFTLAAPVIKIKTTASSGKPTVSWAAVDNADKYEVYRATSKTGKYSKMLTTTKTSYTNTGATAGYTYYYKVKAVTDDGTKSDFSNIKSITCDCAQPVVKITTVASSGKPKLTWDKVTGATKYEIYRATSKSGKYTKMYTTTGTSYTNSSATAGKTYYYKVKAICGKSSYGNSAYSTIKSITCDCARPVVKITTSNGDPKLSWAKVEGATKYEVYRATSKSGTYTRMLTTTKTSYTNTSAKAGKTYYYKVKAVCGASSYGNSAYSTVVSIKAR